MKFQSKQNRLGVMRASVVGLLFFSLGSVSDSNEQQKPDAEASPDAGLSFVQVPAEQSGLTHRLVLNPSEDAKLGSIKWPWMSPPVDINGDGHLDIMTFGHHGGGAAVWLGKGDGTFEFDDRGYNARWVFRGRDPIWMDLTGNGAMDGIGTEHVPTRVFINDGTGHWQDSGLRIPGMFVDTNGDGRFDGVWNRGTLRRMEPALWQWDSTPPEKLTLTEVWNAEEALDWPTGVERGRFGGWREAYSVDLTGDDRNELILNVQGPGFHTRQIVSWVLTRATGPDGQETWTDTTAARGLPTAVGHCLFPEDVDVDGHLDLVDLETGFWYRNDGQGKFAASPYRIFDPETRQVGRRTGMRPWSPDNDLDWIDLDNNGFRDLVTGTVHHSATVSGATFLNVGGGRFVEADGVPGRRGRKFGDVNGNGKLDMIRLEDGQVNLYRNQTEHYGLHVRLAPRAAAEGFLGAKLWAYEAGHLGDKTKLVHYRQGFMHQRPHRSNVIADMHIGLGQREAVDIRVRFPSGVIREIRGAQAETRVVIEEQANDTP